MKIRRVDKNAGVLHEGIGDIGIGDIEFDDGALYAVSMLFLGIEPSRVDVMFRNKFSGERFSVGMVAIAEVVREFELKPIEDPEEVLP